MDYPGLFVFESLVITWLFNLVTGNPSYLLYQARGTVACGSTKRKLRSQPCSKSKVKLSRGGG